MDNATGVSQRRKTGWMWILPMITLYLAINRISFTTFMVILAVCVVILHQDLRRDPRQPSDSGDTPVPSVKLDSSNFTRADVSHSDDPSFFVRSNALWLEDGNFVILVQSTAFRFYGGLLSIHSPVFRDMFSLPQPRGVERFDGCPFIRLYDSAEDFSYFLQVLLGTIILDVETTPIHAIAAILRISTKYEASMIRQRCIKVLELTYPSTLAGWLQSPSSEAIGSSEELHLRHFHIANLARETNALNILPVALLMCCMGTLPDIMDGMVLPDGYRVELCPENRRAVLIGRQALSHLARTETHKNLFSINDLPDVSNLQLAELNGVEKQNGYCNSPQMTGSVL
ncbi:unnamed protein product [Somion occarium]|uniref:BTB domain-containing protein n=2 Tax=Somion occarium TaxID=3059160 RepID=A0ABP1DE67_9APHY